MAPFSVGEPARTGRGGACHRPEHEGRTTSPALVLVKVHDHLGWNAAADVVPVLEATLKQCGHTVCQGLGPTSQADCHVIAVFGEQEDWELLCGRVNAMVVANKPGASNPGGRVPFLPVGVVSVYLRTPLDLIEGNFLPVLLGEHGCDPAITGHFRLSVPAGVHCGSDDDVLRSEVLGSLTGVFSAPTAGPRLCAKNRVPLRVFGWPGSPQRRVRAPLLARANFCNVNHSSSESRLLTARCPPPKNLSTSIGMNGAATIEMPWLTRVMGSNHLMSPRTYIA